MALYNVERPMNFSEVLGQDKNVKIFREILKSENLPNAFLFIGVRGTGKTSSARLFERALNCEHPKEDGSPCNECASCKEILNGTSMDVVELDAASHGGVDDIHEVLKLIQYTPVHSKKILVLDEVHMLSNAAFNALLKTIEEPPKDVIFIFCTTEEHKVPATIISRCRRFVFERISDEVIEGKLADICKKNNITFEEEALGIIARAAKGGMRDALSILEQFMQGDITTNVVKETLGIADEDAIFDILTAVAKGDTVSAVSVLRSLIKKGKNLDVLLKALIDGLIDSVYTMQTGEKVNNTQLYLAGVERFINAVKSESMALSFVDQLSKVYEVSRKDADMSFALEMTLMKMVDYTSELGDIQDRLSNAERRLDDMAKGIGFSNIEPPAAIEISTLPQLSEDTAEDFDTELTADENPFLSETPVEGINMPIELESENEDIPLSMSEFDMEGFEQGEDISLSELLTEEPSDVPIEEPVVAEEEAVAEVEEEPDLLGDFFNLGGAWQ